MPYLQASFPVHSVTAAGYIIMWKSVSNTNDTAAANKKMAAWAVMTKARCFQINHSLASMHLSGYTKAVAQAMRCS